MAIAPVTYNVVSEGDEVTLSFHVVNTEDVTVANATLTFSAFPSGVTFVGAYKDKGSYDEVLRKWTIPLLAANEATTLYLRVIATSLTVTKTITATLVNCVNDISPGEGETTITSYIRLEPPEAVHFDGYAIKELLSIHTNQSGDTNILYEPVLHTIVATGNANYILPSVYDLNAGDFICFKVLSDGGNTVKIKGNAAETIEGSNEITLTTGDYVKLVVCRSCPSNMWFKANN